MLKVCLLATGGMMPLPDRYLTSLVTNYSGSIILIDCGEGTQILLKKLKWGFKGIDVICITHYHADHVAGLPGLLSTIGNSGRTEPITIIGPEGLREVVNGLTVIVPSLPFELNLIEINQGDIKEYKYKDYVISYIPVEHGIPCMAYSIEAKRSKKFNREKAEALGVPKILWNKLQKEEVVQYDNKIFTPEMVLGEARKGIKISYCTDSRPISGLIEFIRESDLFIGEGMYGDDSYLEKAKLNGHMLFSECASLAKEGSVKELWLTHFSPLLYNPEEFLHNATNIFENTKLGQELLSKELIFER